MRDVIDRSPHDDQADLKQEIAEIRRHLDHDQDMDPEERSWYERWLDNLEYPNRYRVIMDDQGHIQLIDNY